jgi:hypothetical protein
MDQPEGVGKGALVRPSHNEAETGDVYRVFFPACIAALELEQVVFEEI